MADEFAPVLYLKDECPFCLKLRVFLVHVGLLDRFHLREFASDSKEEKRVQGELSEHFDKFSFPAARIAPDELEKDSDALVDTLARQFGVDPSKLKTCRAYVEGPFSTWSSLSRRRRN